MAGDPLSSLISGSPSFEVGGGGPSESFSGDATSSATQGADFITYGGGNPFEKVSSLAVVGGLVLGAVWLMQKR